MTTALLRKPAERKVPRPPGATVELPHVSAQDAELVRHRGLLDVLPLVVVFCLLCGIFVYSQNGICSELPPHVLNFKIHSAERIDSKEKNRTPWIVLRFSSASTEKWYFDPNAFRHGMSVVVVDSKGKRLPLTDKAEKLIEFKELQYPRRIWTFGPNTEYHLPIGELAKLVEGADYSVEISWTLNIHDVDITRLAPRKRLDPTRTQKVTLKAGPMKLKWPPENRT